MCFSIVMLISSFKTYTTDRSHIGHSSDCLLKNEGTFEHLCWVISLCSSQKYNWQWEQRVGKKSSWLQEGSAQFLPMCGSSILSMSPRITYTIECVKKNDASNLFLQLSLLLFSSY